MQGDAGKVQLQPHDWKIAREAWTLFSRKDAGGLMRLLEHEPFERLPKMKKALLRCIEEIPDQKGLSGTQRKILQLVAGGRHEFMEIFKGLAALEEYPFLGDTACQRLLDQLVLNGFLIRSRKGYELS